METQEQSFQRILKRKGTYEKYSPFIEIIEFGTYVKKKRGAHEEKPNENNDLVEEFGQKYKYICKTCDKTGTDLVGQLSNVNRHLKVSD